MGFRKNTLMRVPLPRSHMGSDLYAPLCTLNLHSDFEFLPDLKISMELELEWLEC